VREYKGELDKAMEITKGLNSTELYELVFNATLKHKAQLEALLDEIPEEARDAINTAITVSEKGHEEATKALERERGRP
jgi:hypothetical protein